MKNQIKSALNEYASHITGGELVDESHFYDFRQNIFSGEMDERFKKMFVAGDGNELVAKAAAVNSSSMLGYNFFHWIDKESPLTIDSVEYNEVLFEVKIPVLKGTTPANMDIVLKSNAGDYMFIESKFLEYLKADSFKFSDTYMDKDAPQKYYCHGEEWASFIKGFDHTKKGVYWSGIKQEICHMIGLTNWLNGGPGIGDGEKYSGSGNIRFINLVFEPNHVYVSDHKKFVSYMNLYNAFHSKLSNASWVPRNVRIEFKTYSEIWPNIVSSKLPAGLEKYLFDHYMKFAEGASI